MLSSAAWRRSEWPLDPGSWRARSDFPPNCCLPPGWCWFLGLIALAVIAYRSSVPSGVMTVVIATNFAWVAASLIVAFGPIFAPTLFGKVFVVAQAATVAILAELQIVSLRRTRPTG
jgi:hypothetical protein